MNIEYTKGGVEQMKPHLPLLSEHWEESARNKELMVLLPDWEKYTALELQGKLHVIEARYAAELVGYSVNIIDTHMHYASLTVCYNDLLYVNPDYRASPAGLRLMQKTREYASALGAKLMLWHAKQGTALEKILGRRKSTKVQEIVFSEEL